MNIYTFVPTEHVFRTSVIIHELKCQLSSHYVNGYSDRIVYFTLSALTNGTFVWIGQNLLKKQVETRTADGRRRITPLCIAQLDTG